MINFLLPKPILPSLFIKNKIIFTHIPKCAGSSLLNSLLGYQIGHKTLASYKKYYPTFFSSAYKFTFVRNPFSRFQSALNYAFNPCNSCLWPEVALFQNKFKNTSIIQLLNDLDTNGWNEDLDQFSWFKDQSFFIRDKRGAILVDQVFKTEEYSDACEFLQHKKRLDLFHSSSVINKGNTDKLYDVNLKSIKSLVEKRYFKDYSLFSYY